MEEQLCGQCTNWETLHITMHYVLGLEISLSYTQILGRKRLKRTNVPGLF